MSWNDHFLETQLKKILGNWEETIMKEKFGKLSKILAAHETSSWNSTLVALFIAFYTKRDKNIEAFWDREFYLQNMDEKSESNESCWI